MNACAELRMPAHYVDMSQKEMEYDGGFCWSLALNIASCVVSVAGFACSVIGKRTNNSTLSNIGRGCTVVGAAMSLFTIGGIVRSCARGVALTDAQFFAGAYVSSIGVSDIITGVALW